MIRANISKNMGAIMAKCLNGLDIDIANIVELHYYLDIEDMIHMAI